MINHRNACYNSVQKVQQKFCAQDIMTTQSLQRSGFCVVLMENADKKEEKGEW